MIVQRISNSMSKEVGTELKGSFDSWKIPNHLGKKIVAHQLTRQ